MIKNFSRTFYIVIFLIASFLFIVGVLTYRSVDILENVQNKNQVISSFGNTNGNINEIGRIVSKDGWIYYTNESDNAYLYRARSDMSEKECIFRKKVII